MSLVVTGHPSGNAWDRTALTLSDSRMNQRWHGPSAAHGTLLRKDSLELLCRCQDHEPGGHRRKCRLPSRMLSLGSEARLQGCLCYCLKMEQKEFFLHRSQADGFSLSAAQVSGCLPPTSVPTLPPPPILPSFRACLPQFVK